MNWAKLGKTLWFTVGFIPYIGLAFLVVIMWEKHIGWTPLEDMDIWNSTTPVFTPQNIFGSLSLLGSWVLWHKFRKLIEYFRWTHD